MSKFQIGDKVRHRNDTESWPDRTVLATGFVRPGGYEWVVAQLCTDSPHTYNAVDLEPVPVDVFRYSNIYTWGSVQGWSASRRRPDEVSYLGVLVWNKTKGTVVFEPAK